MPRRKLQYREGDWIAVPLECGGYALGLAARVDRHGILLGYFFAPRYEMLPTLDQIGDRDTKDAIAVGLVGGLGFKEATWRVVGRQEPWEVAKWPVPIFGRYDEALGIARRLFYPEDLDFERVSEEPATFEEIRNLPRDGLWGSGFAEARLSSLLCDGL